jgi:hypothetical protein
MGAWPRLNSIIALLTQRAANHPDFKKYIEQTRALGNDSRVPSERRNRIIHDPWYLDQTADQVAQHKKMAKDELIYGIKDVDMDIIEKTLGHIKGLSDRAWTLRFDIVGEIGTSR